MSTLVQDKLEPGIIFPQKFKINRDLQVAHIRPWIYKQGTLVDGDLTCEVYENGTLLATSTINYQDINDAIIAPYFHGFIRFDFESLVLHLEEGQTESEYEVRFYMDNHTLDNSNFIAINRNWDLKIYNTYGPGVVSNQAINDMIEPAGLEIFEYRSI